jgi:hypothetical protein
VILSRNRPPNQPAWLAIDSGEARPQRQHFQLQDGARARATSEGQQKREDDGHGGRESFVVVASKINGINGNGLFNRHSRPATPTSMILAGRDTGEAVDVGEPQDTYCSSRSSPTRTAKEPPTSYRASSNPPASQNRGRPAEFGRCDCAFLPLPPSCDRIGPAVLPRE